MQSEGSSTNRKGRHLCVQAAKRKTGVVLGPAVRPLTRYEVVEQDGGIFVTVRNS